MTVSFSIDERDANGRKRSAFYSLTVSRKEDEGETKRSPSGFTGDEVRLVRAIISKQVVATVYDDAVKRGMLPGGLAKDELGPILNAYDATIAKHLSGEANGS